MEGKVHPQVRAGTLLKKCANPRIDVLTPCYSGVLDVKEMLSKKDFSEKTYNRCLYCEHRAVRCNGPRTSAMDLDRWREFMRDMKSVEGLTYADIAARSGIPAKTIERKLSPGGDGQDIMRGIATAIESAILGSTPHPCYNAFLEANPGHGKIENELEVEIARLHHEIELLHQSYREELATVRADDLKKIDYLRAENEKKDRIIERLLNK